MTEAMRDTEDGVDVEGVASDIVWAFRDVLVRIVVAQQWVVAISFWWNEARALGLDDPESRWSDDDYAAAAAVAAKNMRVTQMVRHFARQPCADDVVDGEAR